MMEFEWDEDKRLANVKNHGIDFVDVPEVFDGDIFTVEDDSRSGGVANATVTESSVLLPSVC